MPPADLRALAASLDLLKPCECALRIRDSCGCVASYPCFWCDDTGRRLPAEDEVRAAIFEAGWNVLNIRSEAIFARVEACRPSEQREAYAIIPEAAEPDLVLLALLRALEVCRGR